MTKPSPILVASAKHPLSPDTEYQYGTAGFRMKAELLDSVVFRVGLLAGLRSKKLGGQIVGVMITASHNPPGDNGVKLVDPLGEMLESSWEPHATTLANATSDQDLTEVYNKLVTTLRVKLDGPAKVVFARDTRASGPALTESLKDALKATRIEFVDYGILTTPQLHYIVRCLNTQHRTLPYGEPTEEGYYKKMAAAFKIAMKYKKTKGPVTVDCANGVGGPKLHELAKYLASAAEGGIDIKVVNDNISDPEALNVQCGADYVKTQQRAPPSTRAGTMDRCASLDGDADRIIYYFFDTDNRFHLLDGDRIATLIAVFLGELCRNAGVADSVKVGIVQTAYANGAATEYITKMLKLPVTCTNTGVKHLHHAAARYDIGVYFEANGHGTVLFSSSAQQTIREQEPSSPAQQAALHTLLALNDLANQAVGDALADLLLVEVVLANKNWTCQEWLGTYKDLPNRLARVEVDDRSIFHAVDAERKLESPEGCQAEIDTIVSRYKEGRSFVRASGTEDAVRVYAEAATRSEADDLAHKIAEIVRRYGNLHYI